MKRLYLTIWKCKHLTATETRMTTDYLSRKCQHRLIHILLTRRKLGDCCWVGWRLANLLYILIRTITIYVDICTFKIDVVKVVSGIVTKSDVTLYVDEFEWYRETTHVNVPLNWFCDPCIGLLPNTIDRPEPNYSQTKVNRNLGSI
jgi:hypothetical protein